MRKLYIPPTLIAYCLITMTLLYFYAPEYNWIKFPINLTGLLIAFLGFFLMGKARDLFKKHQTTVRLGESKHMIDEGVFSKSRNPMYVGMFILILGFCIVSTNILAFILPVLFLIIVRLAFIRKEEKLLLDKFGKKYLEYKKNVRRWI